MAPSWQEKVQNNRSVFTDKHRVDLWHNFAVLLFALYFPPNLPNCVFKGEEIAVGLRRKTQPFAGHFRFLIIRPASLTVQLK